MLKIDKAGKNIHFNTTPPIPKNIPVQPPKLHSIIPKHTIGCKPKITGKTSNLPKGKIGIWLVLAFAMQALQWLKFPNHSEM